MSYAAVTASSTSSVFDQPFAAATSGSVGLGGAPTPSDSYPAAMPTAAVTMHDRWDVLVSEERITADLAAGCGSCGCSNKLAPHYVRTCRRMNRERIRGGGTREVREHCHAQLSGFAVHPSDESAVSPPGPPFPTQGLSDCTTETLAAPLLSLAHPRSRSIMRAFILIANSPSVARSTAASRLFRPPLRRYKASRSEDMHGRPANRNDRSLLRVRAPLQPPNIMHLLLHLPHYSAFPSPDNI